MQMLGTTLCDLRWRSQRKRPGARGEWQRRADGVVAQRLLSIVSTTGHLSGLSAHDPVTRNKRRNSHQIRPHQPSASTLGMARRRSQHQAAVRPSWPRGRSALKRRRRHSAQRSQQRRGRGECDAQNKKQSAGAAKRSVRTLPPTRVATVAAARCLWGDAGRQFARHDRARVWRLAS
jgi:hypothetical protein